MIKRESTEKSGRLLRFQSGPVLEDALRPQFFPLLDLRVVCLLLFASFLTAGSSGDDSARSGCLDPLLVAGFLTAGSLWDDGSGFCRLDPPLAVCFVSSATSGEGAGRLDPLLLSFFTAGVLGFFAGAALLTGVAFEGSGEDSFLRTFSLADKIAEDGAFLAGDFLARERPLPLAFDWLTLRDFLAGGGRRALGGGLF